MTPEELDIKRIREEHATLLRDKVAAEAAWHAEVRSTLKQHGESLHTIQSQLSDRAGLRLDIDGMETRVKKLEDFRLQVVAYWVAGCAVIIALWKLIDHFVK